MEEIFAVEADEKVLGLQGAAWPRWEKEEAWRVHTGTFLEVNCTWPQGCVVPAKDGLMQQRVH